MDVNKEEKTLLPHHEQMPLCTTRLPYRQGRKLTAVKVYTINDESNHLLVFGVPSLNLRQETKALFCKFGKLIHFTITDKHASEVFTETYHAIFERIQSARAAKRMLDMKNFYGGSLHVCYAPELESLEETRQKLMQRRREVFVRLNRNHKELIDGSKRAPSSEPVVKKPQLLNMGESNIIMAVPNVRKRKIYSGKVSCKKSRSNETPEVDVDLSGQGSTGVQCDSSNNDQDLKNTNTETCSSADIESNKGQDVKTASDFSECDKIELNYSGFGKEIVKKGQMSTQIAKVVILIDACTPNGINHALLAF